METTKDRLADALVKANLPEMAALARDGYYGDFTSPIAFPKMTLVTLLEQNGEVALANKVRNGEFDDYDSED